MAQQTATISGPVTVPGRTPVEITPGMTAKQLVAAIEGSEEALGSLTQNAPWLKTGPFGGRIIQALFRIPFKAEGVSDDPVETLAEIYLKLRRLWPVIVHGQVVWLLGVMRDWWGGLPVSELSRATPRQPPPSESQDDEEEEEDDEEDMPEEFEVSFTTSGAMGRVPVATDYSATIEFSDGDKDTLRDIRRRYLGGELTKSAAIHSVIDLLEERTRDCFYAGNADEGDDHWYDSEAEIDRDDECIDDINVRGEATIIVDAWV